MAAIQPGGAVEVDLSNFPVSWRLKLDSSRVMARVGRKVAAAARRRIKAGKGLRAGQTLVDTGQLVRSVRFDRRLGAVGPNFRSRSDVSRRARNSYGLLKIHLAGRYRRKGAYDQRPTDPLGTEDAAMWAKIEAWTQQAVAAELKSGGGGLVGELRRSAGLGGRRRSARRVSVQR